MQNKINLKEIILFSTLLLTLCFSSGCLALVVGAAAGAGGIAYVKGALEKNFDKPVLAVHKASLSTLKNLKMTIKEEKLDQHKGTIKAEDSAGKSVTIESEALTEKSSKITIRFGVFGDESRSQMILNAIQKRL